MLYILNSILLNSIRHVLNENTAMIFNLRSVFFSIVQFPYILPCFCHLAFSFLFEHVFLLFIAVPTQMQSTLSGTVQLSKPYINVMV